MAQPIGGGVCSRTMIAASATTQTVRATVTVRAARLKTGAAPDGRAGAGHGAVGGGVPDGRVELDAVADPPLVRHPSLVPDGAGRDEDAEEGGDQGDEVLSGEPVHPRDGTHGCAVPGCT
ncbi:hypothetical protein [Streptomyces narbonensis]|uniref:hypothetical protein n=1 Tax=Streptomyces narbonensis TaxID=67333 RepID=UPI003626EDC0